MKKLYFVSAALLAVLIGFQSCSKQSPDQMIASPSSPAVVVNISANQTYQLTLDNSVSLGILKQASHFRVSNTELDVKNGVMIYKYLPAFNYIGTDEVVLSTIKATTIARTGCSNGQDISSNSVTYTTSYTTLKINITDK